MDSLELFPGVDWCDPLTMQKLDDDPLVSLPLFATLEHGACDVQLSVQTMFSESK